MMPLFYRDLRERALAETYHRYYRRLCAVAAAVLDGDAALAEDAVQEAWLRLNALGVRERIDTGDAVRLRGLLLVTVRNTARNLRRGNREQTLSEEGWALFRDPGPSPAEQTEKGAAVEALCRGLQALPAADHDVLLLQYVQGLSAEEIALVLGISETAVRQRACRARRRLKKLLQQEGYDDEP